MEVGVGEAAVEEAAAGEAAAEISGRVCGG